MLKNIFAFFYYVYKKPSRFFHFIKTGYITGIEIIIDHDKKFVYVLNPKVATSTIVEFLSGVKYRSTPDMSQKQKKKLRGISYLKGAGQLEDLKSQGYFVFTFVRDPYDRLVSLFKSKYKLRADGKYEKEKFALSYGLDVVDDFEDMVKKICEIPDSLSDTHFMSQAAILYGQAKGFNYDFIGRLESFDSDFSFIEEKLGDSRAVNKCNAISIKNNLTSSDFLKRVIRSRYKNDYFIFSYDNE